MYHEHGSKLSAFYMEPNCIFKKYLKVFCIENSTGELGYDGLNETRKIGPSYAKSVIYI